MWLFKLKKKSINLYRWHKKKEKINYLLVELKFTVNVKSPHPYFAIHVLIVKEINKSILYQFCFFKSKNSLKAEGQVYRAELPKNPASGLRKVTSPLSTS